MRKWNTYGPLWEGPIGFLQANSKVYDTSRMDTQPNCFKKEDMERLFIHCLYFTTGPGFGDHEHKAPVNWQIKILDGIEWIYGESWAQTPEWVQFPRPGKETEFTAWIATPLFHDKYLLCTFSSFGTLPAEPSNQLMFERIHKIIPSLNLQLSPEAAKQKAATEQQYPYAKYSQHRDPEPWRYYGSWREGNILAGEDKIVFEGECTPPPNLNS